MTRSLSAGETLTRSAAFHALGSAYDHHDERRTSIGSSGHHRGTHSDANALQHVKSNRPYPALFSRLSRSASYVPQSEDQNGNFPVKVL